MKKYTLPQYYVIKRDESNPLWKKFIDYMNELYDRDWTGIRANYYGFDGTFSCFDNISSLFYNPELITLEKWKSSFEEEFVLPEKWCIMSTKYNLKEVTKYFNKINTLNYYVHANVKIREKLVTVAYAKVQNKYKKITTEQFIEHVYNPKFKKENTMEVKLTREFLDKAYNAAKSQNDNTVGLIRAEVNAFDLTTTQDFIDRMKKRFKNCSEWSAILEKEFPTKKEIEWDRIKTGSVVMIKHTRQHCNGVENIELSEPVNVIFYKTAHNINKNNIFSLVGFYNLYSTFEQNGKFILFGSDESVDYITEVISY